MKNISAAILSLSALLAPLFVSAQVDKRVEVTKDYEPAVAGAVKLPIAPDMADTVKMRPEIDYSITPLMYSTELVTAHSFRPSKITYWDFNRPTNFYLKLGVGYPVNTVGDFYMSTHNVRTGYLMAAANHYGEFGKRLNWFDYKRNALKASTKARVAGGLYWGERMFEGEVAYGSEVAKRYAAPADITGPTAEYEDFTLKLRLGDDFVDLSRTNFNVDLFGSFFHDKSDLLVEPYKLQQFDFGFDGRVGRAFGRHTIGATVSYNGIRGIKDLHGKDDTVTAGLRYGYSSERVELEVGADYCFDNSDRAHHYVLPSAKLRLNITDNGSVIPFVELGSGLHSNDWYSLARHTVYAGYSEDMASLPNTLSYDLQFGFAGKFGRGRFGYRLYAGMAHEENALYWYNFDYEWLRAAAARRESLTLNLELEYRPIDRLIMSAGVHGRFFREYAELDGFDMAGGESPVEGYFKLRYRHKKFSVGASVKVCGATEWTVVGIEPSAENPDVMIASTPKNVEMPAYADLGIEFEWNINDDWKLFVEGTNLANMKICDFAYLRQQGIGCTAGFKFTF